MSSRIRVINLNHTDIKIGNMLSTYPTSTVRIHGHTSQSGNEVEVFAKLDEFDLRRLSYKIRDRLIELRDARNMCNDANLEIFSVL